MRRENEKLIIDGNAIYELDLECVRKKTRKTGRKWQVCGAVGRKKTVRKPYRGLKAISGKSFCPERD